MNILNRYENNIRAFVAKNVFRIIKKSVKISVICGNQNKKSTLKRMLNILNLIQIIFPKPKHLPQEWLHLPHPVH